MFNELNTNRTIKAGIDTEGMDFKPLSEWEGKVIPVDGFFFTKAGKYGEQVVVVGNGYLINMPKRAVEQFKKIAENDNMLTAVLNGKLIIKDIKANVQTDKGVTTSYKLADV